MPSWVRATTGRSPPKKSTQPAVTQRRSSRGHETQSTRQKRQDLENNYVEPNKVTTLVDTSLHTQGNDSAYVYSADAQDATDDVQYTETLDDNHYATPIYAAAQPQDATAKPAYQNVDGVSSNI